MTSVRLFSRVLSVLPITFFSSLPTFAVSSQLPERFAVNSDTFSEVYPVPGSEVLLAQAITPANDGTGTVVTPDGNRFNIEGGTRSGDGENLFHSFEKFGLDEGQIANFLSNPEIRNILGRVVGGDASIINGLIEMTGGSSNLFLINPSGILFGPNSQLNLPGDFTATTANGVQFGEEWFNAEGLNNYEILMGNPTGFAFTMTNPGSVINLGTLAVERGQNLTLLGGTVVNAGQLSAPEGQVIITSVPGENFVRISQAGQLLSLEIQPIVPGSSQPNNWSIPITSLPDLLTRGASGYDMVAKVNSDGSVDLTVSNTTVPVNSGTTIASGEVDVSGETGGTVGVFGERIGVVDANINASGTNGGGTVLIGGEYKGQGEVPNALRTFVNRNTIINADGLLSGDGGRVIVWADEVTGFYGNVNTRGGSELGNGGFVEVSGKESLIFDGIVDTSAVNGSVGTLLLDPRNITISNEPSSPGVDEGLPDIFQDDLANQDVTVNSTTLEQQTGNVTLEATENITIANGVSLIFVEGDGSITFTADADNNNSGNFLMDQTQSINTVGRNLTISGVEITMGRISTQGTTPPGGNVTLNAERNNGTIFVQSNDNNIAAIATDGGIITMTAGNDTAEQGGSIQVNGQINSGIFPSADDSGGGDIEINALGNNSLIDIKTPDDDTTEVDLTTPLVTNGEGEINLTASGNGGQILITNGLAAIDNQFAAIVTERGNITLTVGNETANQRSSIKISGDINSTMSPFPITVTLNSLGNSSEIVVQRIAASGGIINLNAGSETATQSSSIRVEDYIGTSSIRGGEINIRLFGNNSTLDVGDLRTTGGEIDITVGDTNSEGSQINIGSIDTDRNDIDPGLDPNNPADSIANIELNARGNDAQITVGNLNTTGGNVTLAAGNDTATQGGSITIATPESFNPPEEFATIRTGGGNVILNSLGNNSTITLDALEGFPAITTGGGAVNFTAGNENATESSSITINGEINTSGGGSGGDINLNALGNGGEITTGILGTNGGSVNFTAGNETATESSSITINGEINTSGGGAGGDINLDALGNGGQIIIGNSDIVGNLGTNGGTVNFTAGYETATESSSITINGEINTSGGGSGGDINLNALGNGGEIIITGDLSTGGGNITFSSSQNSTASPNGATLIVNSNQEFNSGTGTILFDNVGVEAGSNTLTLTANEINFDISGNNRLIAGSGNLILQPFSLDQEITLGTENDPNNTSLNLSQNDLNLINGFSSIIIGRIDLQANINLEENTLFSDPVTLQAGSGSILSSNNSGITGTDNASITLNANREINIGNLQTNGEVIQLNVNNGAILTGDIFTNGQDFNLEVGDGFTTESTLVQTGNINTSSTTTNGGNINLDVQSGSGTATLQTDDLISTSTNGETGFITINAGSDSGNSTITIGNINPAILTGQGANISFTSITANDGTITQTQNGSTVTLNNNQIFNAGTGTISLDNVGIAAGNNNLTLTADEINFDVDNNRTLSGSENLTLQPFTPDRGINIANSDNTDTTTLNITQAEIDLIQNGFNSITIGRDNSSGTITVVNPVTFNDPLTLQTPLGDIIVNGTLTGLDNASITLTGSGETTILNADIITAGNPITINDSVVVGVNTVNLDTTNNLNQPGANITILGTVNGTNPNIETLNLTAGVGDVNFNNAIGNLIPLSILQINSAANVTFSNALTTDNITLTSDEINFEGGNNSVTGNFITLEPNTVSNIAIAGSTDTETGTLNLTTTDLAALNNFESIFIGRFDFNGNILIENNAQFSDSVTLEAGSGLIISNNNAGIIGTDDASITLNADSEINVGQLSTEGEAINLTSIGDTGQVTTGNITTNGGNLNILAGNNSTENLTPNSITTGTINTSSNSGNGGNVNLDVQSGSGTATLQTGEINTTSINGSGGVVNLNAGQNTGVSNITVGNINSSVNGGIGGNIIFSSFIGREQEVLSPDGANLTLNSNQTINAGTETITFNNVGVVAENNNLTLTADEIDFDISGNNRTISGNGNLTLQPFTANQNITIDGTDSEASTTLDLTSNELGLLNNGFNSITIGRTDSSGTITIGNRVTFNDPITLQSPEGSINIGGIITGREDASITLNANLINLSEAITTDNQNITIQGNEINLNGNTTLDTDNTGGGDISINGNVNGNSDLTLTTGTGNISFSGTIGETQPVGNITANSSGITEFSGTVNANSLTTDAGGSTQLNGNITTTNNQTYNDAVNLLGDVTLDSSNGNGNLNFTSTIDGNFNLQLNSGTGNITLGTVGDNQPLSSLTVNSQGQTNLGGNITTNGSDGVNFENTATVQLSDNIIIDTSSGNGIINFSQASIDGNFDLELNAGSGEINLGTVGNNTPLNSLSLTTTGLTTLNSNITTNNNIDFSQATGGTQLNADVVITSNNGNISFENSPITGTGNSLTLDTRGEIFLDNVGENNNEIGGVTITNANIVNLLGNIYTDGGINFPSVTTINLNNETVNLETDSDNGNINLSDASVEGSGGLIINAGSGQVNLGTFGNSIPPESLTVNTSGLTTLNGNLTINNNIDFTQATGGTQLNTDVNITSNTGNISFENSPITGTGNSLTLDTSGNISLNNVGQEGNELGELTISNANIVDLFGNIFTNNNLDFTGASTVNIAESSVTLQTNSVNGNINFSGVPIEATEPVNQLILNAGNGNITLNRVGTNIPLNSLLINTTGETSLAGDINIDGVDGITFENATNIILLDNVIINTASGNGSINFNNATINGNSNLQLNAGTGNITLGTVGNNIPLNILSINTSGLTNLGGNIRISGTDGITFENATNVVLTNDVQIDTSLGNGIINFGTGTVDGNFNLQLSAGNGNIILSTFGDNQTLNLLDIQTTGITTLNGDITTNNRINFTQATGGTVLNTDVEISSNNGDIDFNNSPISGTGNNLTLNAPNGNITLDTVGTSENALGEITVNSSGISRFNATVNANSLTTDTVGTTELNADITTTGENGQNYGDAVNLLSDITLTGDEINFNNNVSGENTSLTLQPFSSNFSIEIGGSSNDNQSVLNLTNTELNLLQNGFNSIQIGGENTGTITAAGNVLFQDTVNLQSGTSSIEATGFTITGTDNAAITFNANQNINVSNIINPNGNISLTTTNGSINANDLVSRSVNLTTGGGNITLNFNQNFSLNNPNVQTNGGNFSINSPAFIQLLGSGNIQTTGGNITLSGTEINSEIDLNSNNPQGQGGNINLTATEGTISTENLNSSGSTGGDITVIAPTAIITGQINSRGTVGDGGNVILDPVGDVEVEFIDAQGGPNGRGGNVLLESTGGFVRVTESFLDQNNINASISTAGGQGGGSITIRHRGGLAEEPIASFEIGNTNLTENDNGTAAAITTGEFTLESGETFPESFTRGNIVLQTDDMEQNNDDMEQNNDDIEQNTDDNIDTSNTIDLPNTDNIDTRIPRGQFTDNVDTSNPDNTDTSDTDNTDTSDTDNIDVPLTPIKELAVNAEVTEVEQRYTQDFEEYWGMSASKPANSLAETRDALSQIAEITGIKPAVIYVNFVPVEYNIEAQQNQIDAREYQSENSSPARGTDQLELILVTGEGQPIRKRIPGVTRRQVLLERDSFLNEIFPSTRWSEDSFLPHAQQFYQWLIAPLEAELTAQEIGNLVFIMDEGLRTLPLAALHNGEQFIVEKYSVGLAPSITLTETNFSNVRNARVLAMGSEEFPADSSLSPLYGVSAEIKAITDIFGNGELFLNENFTTENLIEEQEATPFGIIHLATHAEFNSGQPNNSYIQFWDDKLRLDQVRNLGLNQPPVKLLVLSACETALGNLEAELGFAGFAAKAGVESVVASLWRVNDVATFALMADFYQKLTQAPIKAEALRQAQIALIRGEVRIEGSRLILPDREIPLPEKLVNANIETFSQPHFWAAFTIIGSPW
ncbi:CHAT domain-containing protein [Capilliphycus salinus ALCB114379]|uniref:CHAT domain-containing protein n=1 Tax=Capilliphycus salinus TaxID=2768948 RepID=UPI0039A68850